MPFSPVQLNGAALFHTTVSSAYLIDATPRINLIYLSYLQFKITKYFSLYFPSKQIFPYSSLMKKHCLLTRSYSHNEYFPFLVCFVPECDSIFIYFTNIISFKTSSIFLFFIFFFLCVFFFLFFLTLSLLAITLNAIFSI